MGYQTIREVFRFRGAVSFRVRYVCAVLALRVFDSDLDDKGRPRRVKGRTFRVADVVADPDVMAGLHVSRRQLYDALALAVDAGLLEHTGPGHGSVESAYRFPAKIGAGADLQHQTMIGAGADSGDSGADTPHNSGADSGESGADSATSQSDIAQVSTGAEALGNVGDYRTLDTEEGAAPPQPDPSVVARPAQGDSAAVANSAGGGELREPTHSQRPSAETDDSQEVDPWARAGAYDIDSDAHTSPSLPVATDSSDNGESGAQVVDMRSVLRPKPPVDDEPE